MVCAGSDRFCARPSKPRAPIFTTDISGRGTRRTPQRGLLGFRPYGHENRCTARRRIRSTQTRPHSPVRGAIHPLGRRQSRKKEPEGCKIRIYRYICKGEIRAWSAAQRDVRRHSPRIIRSAHGLCTDADPTTATARARSRSSYVLDISYTYSYCSIGDPKSWPIF